MRKRGIGSAPPREQRFATSGFQANHQRIRGDAIRSFAIRVAGQGHAPVLSHPIQKPPVHPANPVRQRGRADFYPDGPAGQRVDPPGNADMARIRREHTDDAMPCPRTRADIEHIIGRNPDHPIVMVMRGVVLEQAAGRLCTWWWGRDRGLFSQKPGVDPAARRNSWMNDMVPQPAITGPALRACPDNPAGSGWQNPDDAAAGNPGAVTHIQHIIRSNIHNPVGHFAGLRKIQRGQKQSPHYNQTGCKTVR